MNKITIIILMALISFTSSCVAQDNDVKYILLSYVDYEVLTPFRINSDYFETAFRGDIKNAKISDSQGVEKIMKAFEELDVFTEGKMPDVRQKIKIVKKDNSCILLCLDGESAILIDGKPIKFNQKFQNYINRLILEVDSLD
jgi:hypothetical protein